MRTLRLRSSIDIDVQAAKFEVADVDVDAQVLQDDIGISLS